VAPPTGYSAPGFPGQSRTPGLLVADLYYNRYRDYDPSTGRYIQADPIGLAGGASPYSYAMNNPLRYTDPTGLESPTYDKNGRWRSPLAPDADPFGDMFRFFFEDFIDFWYEPSWDNVTPIVVGITPVGKICRKASKFNPFRGKSPKQIEDMFLRKGFRPEGPDPLSGRGNYVNPKSGRPYHIDANHPPPKPPHVGVGRPRGPARDKLPTRDFDL
jgi:RHS repeat-associated protein